MQNVSENFAYKINKNINKATNNQNIEENIELSDCIAAFFAANWTFFFF